MSDSKTAKSIVQAFKSKGKNDMRKKFNTIGLNGKRKNKKKK